MNSQYNCFSFSSLFYNVVRNIKKTRKIKITARENIEGKGQRVGTQGKDQSTKVKGKGIKITEIKGKAGTPTTGKGRRGEDQTGKALSYGKIKARKGENSTIKTPLNFRKKQ